MNPSKFYNQLQVNLFFKWIFVLWTKTHDFESNTYSSHNHCIVVRVRQSYHEGNRVVDTFEVRSSLHAWKGLGWHTDILLQNSAEFPSWGIDHRNELSSQNVNDCLPLCFIGLDFYVLDSLCVELSFKIQKCNWKKTTWLVSLTLAAFPRASLFTAVHPIDFALFSFPFRG